MLPCLFFCGFFPQAHAAGQHQGRRQLVLKARASPRQALWLCGRPGPYGAGVPPRPLCGPGLYILSLIMPQSAGENF